jgi:glyoxylase-like metal-dependent hydrolase (beta-lactamase superfamily II)
MPDQRVLLAFDLVYPAQYHVFTVEPHFDHWLEVLDSLERDPAYGQLLVGHGGTADRSAIAATASYLLDAKEIYETAAGREDFAERLKSAHPAREQPGWVDFSALLLYGAI